MIKAARSQLGGTEIHPHHLLPSVFEASPEEFVIALHDYEPPSVSLLSPSTPSFSRDSDTNRRSSLKAHVCLAFLAGDRIRVLNRDVSGWWDGELMVCEDYMWATAGDGSAHLRGHGGSVNRQREGDMRFVKVLRGWFPSNFVEDAEGRIGYREKPPQESTEPELSRYSHDPVGSHHTLDPSRHVTIDNSDHTIHKQYGRSSHSYGAGTSYHQDHLATSSDRRTSIADSDTSHTSHRSKSSSIAGGAYPVTQSSSGSSVIAPIASSRRGGPGLQRKSLAATALLHRNQQPVEEIERAQSSLGYYRPRTQASIDVGRAHSSLGHYAQTQQSRDQVQHSNEHGGGSWRGDVSSHRRFAEVPGIVTQNWNTVMDEGRGSHQFAHSHGSSAILHKHGRRDDRTLSVDSVETTSSTSISTASNHGTGAEDGQDVEHVLEPVVQAIALVKAAVISRRHAHFQPSTACVISTIRSLLAATNCLNKESTLLAMFPALGKVRKSILANLAELVALARSASLQTTSSSRSPDVEEDEMREMEIEGMVKSADETLDNVRGFLRLVVSCGEALPEKRISDPSVALVTSDEQVDVHSRLDMAAIRGSGPAPTVSQTTRPSITSMGRGMTETTSSTGGPSGYDFRGAEQGRPATSGAKRDRKSSLHAKSISDLRMARKREVEDLTTPDPNRGLGISAPPERAKETHREQPSVSSISSTGTSRSSSSGNTIDHAGPVAFVNGVVLTLASSSRDIHYAVGQTEDKLLSAIAALIGHAHSHTVGSHPSSLAQLIDLTRETVDTTKDLLTIVEAVLDRCSTRSPSSSTDAIRLGQAQTDMYEFCGDLVVNVERIASPTSFHDSDEDDRKAGVIQSATATLRIGAACIHLARTIASEPDFDESKSLSLFAPGDEAMMTRDAFQAAHTSQIRLGSRRQISVGQRGDHTLSALVRKASGLDSLHLKYERDGFLAPATDVEESAPPSSHRTTSDTEDEGEEEIMIHGAEEDFTLQPTQSRGPRPPLRSNLTSPLMSSAFSPSMEATPIAPGRRHRANSMSSPVTPRLLQHRSPSRSADLNLLGGDLAFAKTPRQGDAIEPHSRQSSTVHSGVEDMVRSTPKPREWQDYRVNDRTRQVSNHLEIPSLASFVMPLKHEGELALSSNTGHTASDMRLWLVAHDYSPKDITFNNEGGIAGATLGVLVEKMTTPDATVDPSFSETFFTTFRLFTNAAGLLAALEVRYDLAPPARMPLTPAIIQMWNERKLKPIRSRISNLLNTWVSSYWSAEEDRSVVGTINVFIDERLMNTLPLEALQIREHLLRLTGRPGSMDSKASEAGPVARAKSRQKRKSGSPTSPLYANSFFNAAAASTGLPPTPIMGKQLFNSLRSASTTILITDFHALELARQLTLMEAKLFACVSTEELLRSGVRRAASLSALSTLSNRITGWVADNILNEQDLKKRSGLLKFFIKMADRCLGLNNFSSLFAILAGLNSSTILRLKKTWGGLSTKYRVIMDQLRNLIEHTRNHGNYRAKLRSVEGPALPFLGLILTDITFTSEGNANTRPSAIDPDLKLINFDKYVKLGRIAVDFQRFQRPFNLAVLPDCQTWLEKVLAEKGSGSVDALYRKSLVLEPRIGSESIPSATFEKPSWLQGRL